MSDSTYNWKNSVLGTDYRTEGDKTQKGLPPLVAICIATYRRPVMLGELLTSIRHMEPGNFTARFIVADNDPQGSAENIVNGHREVLPVPIDYIVEEQRGIASARNRLVEEARGIGADYIAFVDDDQVVDPQWLLHLVATAVEFAADVVVGWYELRYDADVPSWSRELRSNRFPGKTGSIMHSLNTGNVLIRLDTLQGIPGPFDKRLNLSGGSDAFLGLQLQMRGTRLIRCAESIVYERISRDRSSARWYFRRAYRSGILRAQKALWIKPTKAKLLREFPRSLLVIIKHSLLLILRITAGRAVIVRHVGGIAGGLGGMVGLLRAGRGFEEYRQIYGE